MMRRKSVAGHRISPIVVVVLTVLGVLCLTLAARADALRVHDAAGLAQALEAAEGGTILLESAAYGDLVIRRTPGAMVTLQAVEPHKASFTTIRIESAGNHRFEAITVGRMAIEGGSSGVGLVSSRVLELLYVRNARDLLIEGNDIRGGLHAVLLNSAQDFVLRDNLIHDAIEDLLRITGDSHNGLVEGNRFLDMRAEDHRATGGHRNHSDAIQMFHAKGKTPHDIVIRRNHIWDDPATGAPTTAPQGIFISDPAAGGYRNILIEENLVAVRASNSIYINGGQENVVVRNNTLIPGPGDGGAIIRLAEKSGMDNSGTTVTGNVMKLLRDETGRSRIGRNYIYGRNAALHRLFAGPGSRWQDFVPKPPSRFALGLGFGAEAYLSDLLAGR